MKIAKACVCCGGADLRRSPAVLMPFVSARVFGWEPVEVTAEFGLRDLPPGRAYGLCATLGCTACGLVFLDMRFDDEEMAALYRDYRGPAYRALRERFEPGYGARNDVLAGGSPYIAVVETLLAPHLPAAPRVLDWGGDTGLNTPFRGRAALHHVYEISDKPAIAGAEAVDLDRVGRERYDLVVSSQVLEHVPHPFASLAEMAAVMGPETLLYVEVPHETLIRTVAGLDARMAGKRHWHEHVNFFTEDAITAMLDRAGLRQVWIRSHEVLAGGRMGHVFSVLARRA